MFNLSTSNTRAARVTPSGLVQALGSSVFPVTMRLVSPHAAATVHFQSVLLPGSGGVGLRYSSAGDDRLGEGRSPVGVELFAATGDSAAAQLSSFQLHARLDIGQLAIDDNWPGGLVQPGASIGSPLSSYSPATGTIWVNGYGGGNLAERVSSRPSTIALATVKVSAAQGSNLVAKSTQLLWSDLISVSPIGLQIVLEPAQTVPSRRPDVISAVVDMRNAKAILRTYTAALLRVQRGYRSPAASQRLPGDMDLNDVVDPRDAILMQAALVGGFALQTAPTRSDGSPNAPVGHGEDGGCLLDIATTQLSGPPGAPSGIQVVYFVLQGMGGLADAVQAAATRPSATAVGAAAPGVVIVQGLASPSLNGSTWSYRLHLPAGAMTKTGSGLGVSIIVASAWDSSSPVILTSDAGPGPRLPRFTVQLSHLSADAMLMHTRVSFPLAYWDAGALTETCGASPPLIPTTTSGPSPSTPPTPPPTALTVNPDVKIASSTGTSTGTTTTVIVSVVSSLIGVLVLIAALLLIVRRRGPSHTLYVRWEPRKTDTTNANDHPWTGYGSQGCFSVRQGRFGSFVRGKEPRLVRGETYRFVMQGLPKTNPFFITAWRSGGMVAQPYEQGVDGWPASGNATLTFAVPMTAPDLLYYNSTNETYVGCRIFIVNTPHQEPYLVPITGDRSHDGPPLMTTTAGGPVTKWPLPSVSPVAEADARPFLVGGRSGSHLHGGMTERQAPNYLPPPTYATVLTTNQPYMAKPAYISPPNYGQALHLKGLMAARAEAARDAAAALEVPPAAAFSFVSLSPRYGGRNNSGLLDSTLSPSAQQVSFEVVDDPRFLTPEPRLTSAGATNGTVVIREATLRQQGGIGVQSTFVAAHHPPPNASLPAHHQQ